MSVHRIKIESLSIPAAQVNPTWSGEITLDKQNDSQFFRSNVEGDFQLKGDDYTTVKDAPDCEKIEMYLEERCGESWVERWRGKFTTYDVKFDENKCLAKVSPKTVDDYDCFLDAWSTDHVVSGASAIVVCREVGGTYESGLECCTSVSATPIPTPVCSTPPLMCYDTTYETQNQAGDYEYTSCFHRIVGIGTTTTPPPYNTGWEYISGNDWWRCPDGDEISAGTFDQGRWFNDVLEYLIDQTGCGLTVRSHFLGINATHDAPPDNLAYDFATANYQALQIHQKSDIKRPYATTPALSFVWKMSPKKLLEDLKKMWQVDWIIDGTDLIIEHVSYFEAATGFDVSQKNIRLDYGKREGGAPNVERFKWADSEATFTEVHAGFPISYGECGDGSEDIRIGYFSNDIYYIYATANPEEIADAGFCLVATKVIEGENVVIDLNISLGWVAIHENLFQHNRYFIDGNMNEADTTFLSTRKTRKLEPFKLTVCCDDGFDPADSIETIIGTSYVQKATVNYFAGADTNLVTIEANI